MHATRQTIGRATWLLALCGLSVASARGYAAESDFRSEIAPLLERHCLACHNDSVAQGELSFSVRESALRGGELGPVVVAGDPAASRLIDQISGPSPEMPKEGEPLTRDAVEKFRSWIAAGAPWPEGVELKYRPNWWSLEPIIAPSPPILKGEAAGRTRTPIDAFVIDRLAGQGMIISPDADRRTLIRRLSYDLIGLPPSYEEVERFVRDTAIDAYERLVDRLLASPAYGEHWARHWLDVVHYADTHGFDKDKTRPNAWPYRDYVICALNEDRPYQRFVQEQLAGDHFFPGSADGVVALGFLAAGPFDYVGQIEVGNGTMEKARVQNIDRDDFVASTMSTFVSATAQCARCHDHKFDPISQLDYYGMQAVFAAVDRADRPFDPDPDVGMLRSQLQAKRTELRNERLGIDQRLRERAGPALEAIERQIETLRATPEAEPQLEFGYHSAIETMQDAVKWVQIDLGASRPIDAVVVVGCRDDFNGIGEGFGFPVRYRIELADDPDFQENVQRVVDRTSADELNPGVAPVHVTLDRPVARYVRVTAIKLAPRKDDFIFALAELMVLSSGENIARGADVQAFDSIEAPPRWSAPNLVDASYVGSGSEALGSELAALQLRRAEMLERATDATLRQRIAELEAQGEINEQRIAALPPPQLVFAAATEFADQGSFLATHGAARPVYLLRRGMESAPDLARGPVAPRAISALSHLDHHFSGLEGKSEAARRAALAEWIVDQTNPLTWRSIVNRLWHFHVGAGLCDSPDDLGRMGQEPTHPELIDWLAADFRDHGQSLKRFHRMLVTSTAYRQSSAHIERWSQVDGGNRYLWRMNRRRLTAEQIRDSVLLVAGKLDRAMGGPGFQVFGFTDDHSPRYDYQVDSLDKSATHRRSIYRFIVRSVPDPFMTTLDCADPSINVAKRNDTLTALQALALLNDRFMVGAAQPFAAKVASSEDSTDARVDAAFRAALGRNADPIERQILGAIAERHGWANACRLMLNLNEFVFVD